MKRLEEKFDTLLAEMAALRGAATSRQSAGTFGVVGDDWTW
jgi:hypothetical protein